MPDIDYPLGWCIEVHPICVTSPQPSKDAQVWWLSGPSIPALEQQIQLDGKTFRFNQGVIITLPGTGFKQRLLG